MVNGRVAKALPSTTPGRLRRLSLSIVLLLLWFICWSATRTATKLPATLRNSHGLGGVEEAVAEEDDSYAEDVRFATQRLENAAFQALTSWPTLPTAIKDIEGSMLLPMIPKKKRAVLVVCKMKKMEEIKKLYKH